MIRREGREEHTAVVVAEGVDVGLELDARPEETVMGIPRHTCAADGSILKVYHRC